MTIDWLRYLEKKIAPSGSFLRAMDAQLSKQFYDITKTELNDRVFLLEPLPATFTVKQVDEFFYVSGDLLIQNLAYRINIYWQHAKNMNTKSKFKNEDIQFWWGKLPLQLFSDAPNFLSELTNFSSRFKIDNQLIVWPHVKLSLGASNIIDIDPIQKLMNQFNKNWNADETALGLIHKIGNIEKSNDGKQISVNIDFGSADLTALKLLLQEIETTDSEISKIQLQNY
ncbi:MAG: hypothetical protein AAFZ15_11915 [Bacteroidota bacterium]